jgi:hypothetical protein
VQRLVKNTVNDMVKRYYGDADNFLIVNKDISVGRIRDLVSSLDTQSKDIMIQLGNPAKILFNNEDELLICLQI